MNDIKSVVSAIDAYFTNAAWFQMGIWPFWILLFTVAAGGVYTARFGKKTLLCRGISGTLNLCGIYQAAILLYTLFPFLRDIPFSLPFLEVTKDTVALMNPMTMKLSVLAPTLLQLMFLMLLVDFVESLNPGGKTILSWLFSQAVTVSISLSAYLVIITGFNFLVPSAAAWIAIVPVVVAALVFLLMLCGKLIFTVVLESGNPQFKNAYGFFTGHKFGSLLTVSSLNFLFTSALSTVLFFTEQTRWTFATVNRRGITFILFLILAAEYFYAMLYCGKKK
jgi:hypothetical protein